VTFKLVFSRFIIFRVHLLHQFCYLCHVSVENSWAGKHLTLTKSVYDWSFLGMAGGDYAFGRDLLFADLSFSTVILFMSLVIIALLVSAYVRLRNIWFKNCISDKVELYKLFIFLSSICRFLPSC
jgi:hypothetical protein